MKTAALPPATVWAEFSQRNQNPYGKFVGLMVSSSRPKVIGLDRVNPFRKGHTNGSLGFDNFAGVELSLFLHLEKTDPL